MTRVNKLIDSSLNWDYIFIFRFDSERCQTLFGVLGSQAGRSCMKSSELEIRAVLRVQKNPVSQKREPPHVALANLPYRKKAFKYFYRRWGYPYRQSTQSWETQVRETRDHLRSAWRGSEAALGSFPRTVSGSFTINRQKITVEVSPWEAIVLLFLRDHLAGKTAICSNPNCLNPFFIRKRKTQNYCEAGPCVKEGQRAHKREWWKRNRGGGTTG